MGITKSYECDIIYIDVNWLQKKKSFFLKTLFDNLNSNNNVLILTRTRTVYLKMNEK